MNKNTSKSDTFKIPDSVFKQKYKKGSTQALSLTPLNYSKERLVSKATVHCRSRYGTKLHADRRREFRLCNINIY